MKRIQREEDEKKRERRKGEQIDNEWRKKK